MHALTNWLRLEHCAGVGPDTARKLLSAFGLPEDIFEASAVALGAVVAARVVRALLAPPSVELQALIERTAQWLTLPGNHVLTLADSDYPQALLEIADPPILLYAKGRIDLLARPSIAIVGSRNATTQGLANAEQFAASLSQTGLTVVSGMALGIDTAAHRGSLPFPGSTVAVIGTGADIVYPARNRALAHEIAATGCILSEYPLGMPAIAANFPRRNRIISGLSSGVLIIEAAAQSGSLITARMAAEQGRDVFAIPGSIHSPLSKGCHLLIKQGAKLVESAQDILEEMQPNVIAAKTVKNVPVVRAAKPAVRVTPSGTSLTLTPGQPGTRSTDQETDDPVLKAMAFEPVSHDLLALRCGLDSAALSARLLDLELAGRVELLPGGAYQRLF